MPWVGIFNETWTSNISINFLLGGYNDANNEVQDFILKFNTTSETWIVVGKMKHTRSGHAVYVIPISDVIQYASNCSYSDK